MSNKWTHRGINVFFVISMTFIGMLMLGVIIDEDNTPLDKVGALILLGAFFLIILYMAGQYYLTGRRVKRDEENDYWV